MGLRLHHVCLNRLEEQVKYTHTSDYDHCLGDCGRWLEMTALFGLTTATTIMNNHVKIWMTH